MLHLPGGGVSAPDLEELERKIQKGDGLVWTGDPRMWLGIGVLEDRRNRRTGRRLEVWRHNEDGSDTLIAHWLPSEQFRVLHDLAMMRADAPGHVSVEDRIDQHNEKMLDEMWSKTREHMMETLDHAVRLHVDRTGPRHKFFLGGRDAARA